jgi:hypothetical protein
MILCIMHVSSNSGLLSFGDTGGRDCIISFLSRSCAFPMMTLTMLATLSLVVKLLYGSFRSCRSSFLRSSDICLRMMSSSLSTIQPNANGLAISSLFVSMLPSSPCSSLSMCWCDVSSFVRLRRMAFYRLMIMIHVSAVIHKNKAFSLPYQSLLDLIEVCFNRVIIGCYEHEWFLHQKKQPLH